MTTENTPRCDEHGIFLYEDEHGRWRHVTGDAVCRPAKS